MITRSGPIHDALLAEIVTSTFHLCNSFVLSHIDFIFGFSTCSQLAKWLEHWTTNSRVAGSSLTFSQDVSFKYVFSHLTNFKFVKLVGTA